MKFTVEHSTIYRYSQPVPLGLHTIRMRPRSTTSQRLLEFGMKIVPEPAGTSEYLDQDGNLALNASFVEPTTEFGVRTHFTAELMRSNPFDYLMPVEAEALPMVYDYPLSAALAPYLSSNDIEESVRQLARDVAAEADGLTASFLSRLNLKLFEGLRHVAREFGSPWSSGQTLAAGEASCRDIAILFVDACRVVGIAARFVSGYERASAEADNATMHAWAETYIPGAGWRGYDPARGLAVADEHVAVAAAFDYNLAAPITGLYYGEVASDMTAKLRVRTS